MWWVWGALALVPCAGLGRTLTVGPGKDYALPSAAVRAAGANDTVLIEPGIYYDCAVVTVPLTIEGHGPGVILTDRTCEEKAILVLRGGDMTVRNLTLARARVGEGNGAGVRLESNSLTLERVVFDNDEVGVLAGDGDGRITVTDCVFTGGGTASSHPLAALFVARIAALAVRDSRFSAARGAQVSSAAAQTEFRGNTVETGAEARGLDIQGALVMEDNTLTAGSAAAAGMVRVDGAGPATLRRNRLQGVPGAVLLQDWTGGTSVLAENVLGPDETEVTTDGVWRHRASSALHRVRVAARALAGQVKRGMLGWIK